AGGNEIRGARCGHAGDRSPRAGDPGAADETLPAGEILVFSRGPETQLKASRRWLRHPGRPAAPPRTTKCLRPASVPPPQRPRVYAVVGLSPTPVLTSRRAAPELGGNIFFARGSSM